MFHHRGPFGPRRGTFFEHFRHHGHHGEEGGGDWPAFGPFGPFGRHRRRHGGQSERMFERGDLKYVILDLLRDQPRHGYDIIRALEERFRGMYSPSPGSVYPTLQLLEDQGYVTSSQQDGKRVYAITDEGRRFLEERAETLEGIHARTSAGWGGDAHAELGALAGELGELARSLFRQSTHRALQDPERVRRLRAAVARARADIESILAGDPTPPPVL